MDDSHLKVPEKSGTFFFELFYKNRSLNSSVLCIVFFGKMVYDVGVGGILECEVEKMKILIPRLKNYLQLILIAIMMSIVLFTISRFIPKSLFVALAIFCCSLLASWSSDLLFSTSDSAKKIESFLNEANQDEDAPNTGKTVLPRPRTKPSLNGNKKYISSSLKDKYQIKKELENNYTQLQKYYIISVDQAKTAFRCAIAFSVLGIMLIAFAVASPHILNIPVEYSLLPTVGVIAGAVVEVFAGTILAVYIKTLSQISIYHTALVDHQRYLSCANLAELMSTTKKRDAMFGAIIREEIKKSSIPQAESSKKKAKVARKKKT